MGYLTKVALGLLASLATTIADDYVCPAGKSDTDIVVGAGDSFLFLTQEGEEYSGNTDCVVRYEMGETCKKMAFSCDPFQLGKGDVLFVKTKKNRKFKKTNFKTQSYAGDMVVRFKTNKKKNDIGAQCRMECVKDAAVTTEAPTTPFTEPTTTTAIEGLQLNPKGDCSLSTCNYVIDGIYAVWWSKEKADQAYWTDKAAEVAGVLSEQRLDLMQNFSLPDPPNVAKGLYVNIYIAHSNGNGVGTEMPERVPFINFASINNGVMAHENHHLFIWAATQGSTSSKWSESRWLIESSAQFYAGQYDKTRYYQDAYTYTTVNPHLALWQHYAYEAAHDPHIFLYYSKHYAMEILLHYLVEEKGVRSNDLLDYYVEERGLSPQEYWYRLLGGDNMRQWFADWAAHNAADMDYLTRKEFKDSKKYYHYLVRIYNSECDPQSACNAHSYVWEGEDTGTGGMVRPPTAPTDLTTRGWSYNVWRLNSTKANTYTFELTGDSVGAEGAESYFLARVVVMNGNVRDNQYYPMVMSSATSGSVRVEVPDGETQVLLVVSAVPEYFKSHQTYGYQVWIYQGDEAPVTVPTTSTTPTTTTTPEGCMMETDVVLCDGQDFYVGNNQNTGSDRECAKLCWDSSGCVAWTRHQGGWCIPLTRAQCKSPTQGWSWGTRECGFH